MLYDPVIQILSSTVISIGCWRLVHRVQSEAVRTPLRWLCVFTGMQALFASMVALGVSLGGTLVGGILGMFLVLVGHFSFFILHLPTALLLGWPDSVLRHGGTYTTAAYFLTLLTYTLLAQISVSLTRRVYRLVAAARG